MSERDGSNGRCGEEREDNEQNVNDRGKYGFIPSYFFPFFHSDIIYPQRLFLKNYNLNWES